MNPVEGSRIAPAQNTTADRATETTVKKGKKGWDKITTPPQHQAGAVGKKTDAFDKEFPPLTSATKKMDHKAMSKKGATPKAQKAMAKVEEVKAKAKPQPERFTLVKRGLKSIVHHFNMLWKDYRETFSRVDNHYNTLKKAVEDLKARKLDHAKDHETVKNFMPLIDNVMEDFKVNLGRLGQGKHKDELDALEKEIGDIKKKFKASLLSKQKEGQSTIQEQEARIAQPAFERTPSTMTKQQRKAEKAKPKEAVQTEDARVAPKPTPQVARQFARGQRFTEEMTEIGDMFEQQTDKVAVREDDRAKPSVESDKAESPAVKTPMTKREQKKAREAKGRVRGQRSHVSKKPLATATPPNTPTKAASPVHSESAKKALKASEARIAREGVDVKPTEMPREKRLRDSEARALKGSEARVGHEADVRARVKAQVDEAVAAHKEREAQESARQKPAQVRSEARIAKEGANVKPSESLREKTLERSERDAAKRIAVRDFKNFLTDGVLKLKRSDGKTVADFFNQYGMRGKFSFGGMTQQDLAVLANKKTPSQEDLKKALTIVNAALTRPYRDVLGRGKDIPLDPKAKDIVAEFTNRMKDL